MEEISTGWYYDYLQKVHENRLSKIKQGMEKVIDNSAPDSLNYMKLRTIGPKHSKEEQSKKILQTNKILIDKLYQISTRKVRNK